MHARAVFLTLLAGLAAGCGRKGTQGGVTVVVNVAPAVRASCVSVAAVSTSGGMEKSTEKATRKETLRFGVASGNGLEGEVRFVARGWLGAGCSVLNAESAPQLYTFVAGRTSDTVTLEVTGALDDADLDGYRALQAGGTDCKDDAGMVFPGADELCTNGEDDDCNALADCADSPRCDGVACTDGRACTTNDSCSGGTCAGTATACVPPSECFRGPATCTDDGGCLFVVDAGTPCDGGSCRFDGTCAPAGTEANCADGLDDDLDGRADCLDVADCTAQLCTSADLCSVMNRCVADGGCAGAPRDCSVTPGPCFDGGACSPANGQCVFPVRVGSCNDTLACTTGDACLLDGGCAGAAVGCSMADDGGCFAPAGLCVEPGGTCAFPARGGFTCSDGNACSFADVCSDAGTCAGAVYTCAAPPVCHEPGSCEGDGGCSFVQSALDAPCNGGTCQADAGCRLGPLPGGWPYKPSNFAPGQVPDSGISATLVIDCANAVFDSNLGLFTPGCFGQAAVSPISVTQDGGPDVWLLPVGGLHVTDAGALRLQGDRPVIFAVYGDAFIAGRLEASTPRGLLVVPGAGGSSLLNRARCGARAGGDGVFTTAGGGGGGGAMVSIGGRGGDALDAGGGDGGIALQRLSLSPLVGGCPGGSGGGAGPGLGSPGGGAVQVSATGTVTLRGLITVSGAGGWHGNFDYTGGGGAGSGGGVLLEGVTVSVAATGRVTANGGGGGAGAGTGGVAIDGEDGSLTGSAPASGGTPALGGERGGTGGTGDAGAGAGFAGVAGGGGGGGTVGLLRINGFSQCSVAAGAVISAQQSDNGCN